MGGSSLAHPVEGNSRRNGPLVDRVSTYATRTKGTSVNTDPTLQNDSIPLDELIDMIDASTTELIFSDDFVAHGQTAAAVLRLAIQGKVTEERAQEVAQDWVDAALDEEERCSLILAAVSDMEETADPERWRDLLIGALSLMSRRHLAAAMAGGLHEVLQ